MTNLEISTDEDSRQVNLNSSTAPIQKETLYRSIDSLLNSAGTEVAYFVVRFDPKGKGSTSVYTGYDREEASKLVIPSRREIQEKEVFWFWEKAKAISFIINGIIQSLKRPS